MKLFSQKMMNINQEESGSNLELLVSYTAVQ